MSSNFYCPYTSQYGGACVPTTGLECKQDSDCPTNTKCMSVGYWSTSWNDCTYGYDPKGLTGVVVED